MRFETDEDVSAFVDKYVAVWNEPDATRRAEAVASLWVEDGVEFTDTRVFRGHEAIESRVTEAYGQFVATGEANVAAGEGSARHHDALSFRIMLVPAGGGIAFWAAEVFVILGEDGRIKSDHQFTGGQAATRGVVTQFLSRLATGDAVHVAELFAETVDWKLDWPAGGHPDVPWIRPRSTRAEVADHFRALARAHVPTERSVGPSPRVLVDGADAVVLGEIHQTVKTTMTPYVAAFALHLTVRDGLINRYHVYEDSLSVATALSNPGGSSATNSTEEPGSHG
jgi:ketosteroid isomerase-like protein